MKFLPAQILYFVHDRRAKRNMRRLFMFMLFMSLVIVIYSVVFHYIMMFEGKYYSWITGVYWTLTVMSTLGFGDITFSSDLGRLFTICVLLSGIVFLLVMLPFTFIQLFYAPFLEAQDKSRAPRKLPDDTSGHLIIIGSSPVALSLATRLKQFNYRYCILVNEVSQALDLVDRGFSVAVGDSDNPETYERLRARQAAMAVLLDNDVKNTNAAYTLNEVAPKLHVVANADSEESVDILQLAGCDHVFPFMRMLGEKLAGRVMGVGPRSNVIGAIGDVQLAEAPVQGTPLVGRKVKDSGLKDATGMNVVGLWNKGQVTTPLPDSVISEDTVLILAGTRRQLEAYDAFAGPAPPMKAPVLILGGGRVGQAAAAVLEQRGVDYMIVEKNPKLVFDAAHYVHGSASDIDVLKAAGIDEAPSVFVTTHDDDLNIYLTIYCRRLRPDIQVISRATLDRNINVLHKAGADLVMSYATMTANTVINILSPGKVMTLTEGLNIFRVQVGSSLAGKTLINSNIREKTGCSVIAVSQGDDLEINPDPARPLEMGAALLVFGAAEDERCFLNTYRG